MKGRMTDHPNMIQIIPAIDMIEGKCVRLTQGDYGKKTIYNENPLEVALEFQDSGLTRLHLVDLDGANPRKISASFLKAVQNR
jgi:phosphoribosylformimino-5-aminoimidazole carboxamide ribotide isomerase